MADGSKPCAASLTALSMHEELVGHLEEGKPGSRRDTRNVRPFVASGWWYLAASCGESSRELAVHQVAVTLISVLSSAGHEEGTFTEPMPFSSGASVRLSQQRRNAAAWAVVAAALAYGWYLRSVDLEPGSLWLDDAWVAVLSRAPSIRDFLIHGSSSPPLFNAIVTLCIWLLPGRELSAQIFPFVCANLAIVATAFAAYLVTRRAWAGAIAAIVVACHPGAIEYAARVKRSLERHARRRRARRRFCFLTDRPSVRSLWIYALAAGACLLLSTTSLFVAATFFPLAVVGLPRRGVGVRHVAGATAVMLAADVLVFYGVVRPGTNAALREFWAPNYLPSDSASAFIRSAQTVPADWVAQCLHGFASSQREYWWWPRGRPRRACCAVAHHHPWTANLCAGQFRAAGRNTVRERVSAFSAGDRSSRSLSGATAGDPAGCGNRLRRPGQALRASDSLGSRSGGFCAAEVSSAENTGVPGSGLVTACYFSRSREEWRRCVAGERPRHVCARLRLAVAAQLRGRRVTRHRLPCRSSNGRHLRDRRTAGRSMELRGACHQ